MKKTFDLGDVLSITTGYLLSEKHIDGVYEILNHLTNDNLFTHQLGRAANEVKPYLRKLLPQLHTPECEAEVSAMAKGLADVPKEKRAAKARENLRVLRVKYGASFDLEPMPAEFHTQRDPMEELCDMVGPEKVIAINTEVPQS